MTSGSYVLKFGTEKHRKILDALWSRYKLSKDKMGETHRKWQDAENTFFCYMPERDADALRRNERENGKPQYTTLVIPYSYAILMTAHTYWTSTFLSRNPIFQFQATHGLVGGNEQAMDTIINYQVMNGGHLPPYYIWLLDVGKYGVGILGSHWAEEYSNVSMIQEEEEMFMGIIPTGKKKKKKITQRLAGYQGNKVFNVRPYHWYPDTRVPLYRFQEGEFCGRYVEMAWHEVYEREQDGEFFNIDVIAPDQVGGGESFVDESPGPERHDPDQTAELPSNKIKETGVVKAIELVVKVVPSQWGLGSGDRHEKWVFTFTTDRRAIIGARPLGCIHDQFPYDLLLLEPEGYQLSSRGMMEILKPLQDTMDWLVNTHFYNVRKALNDQFIVDPSRVVMKDVLDPLPGGIWRLKPSAYGTDPKTVATQLQVVDVTQAHMSDAQAIAQMLQRVSGVTDNIMGVVNEGGRKTATEIRTSSSFGANRLRTQSEYFSATAYGPLATKLVKNTQQYYELERLFRIAGDTMQIGLEKYMQITPETIAGFWDFIPADGTLPVDRYAQANLWREMLLQFRQIPQLAMQYDVAGIFAWVAQLAGLKNIGQFRIQMVPDAAAAAAMASGNGVPLGGVSGAGSSLNAGAGDGAAVPEPGQIAGMGATG